MKPSLTSLHLFVVVIMTLSISSMITTAAAQTVTDTTGREVRNGGKYHIIPIQGGRINLTNEKICPLNVVVNLSSKDKPGDGFYFSHYTRDAFLRTSRILSIDSGKKNVSGCNKSTIWTIPNAEAKAPWNLITTGGDMRKCFQVVNYPRRMHRTPTYMLQYCPSFCGVRVATKTCFNISTYSYKGVTRLASSGGTPFEFGFYKL